MVIQHKDITALLLLYNGKFQIISKPNTQMEMATRDEFIIGHFGEALNAIIPIAISTLDIISDFFGLLPSNNADNSTLSHLKLSGLEVTEPIQVDRLWRCDILARHKSHHPWWYKPQNALYQLPTSCCPPSIRTWDRIDTGEWHSRTCCFEQPPQCPQPQT